MNVLCVNHTGEVSGAERSLLDLMSGLRDEHRRPPRLPDERSAGRRGAERLGIPVDPIPGTAGSLKLDSCPHAVAMSRMTAAAMGSPPPRAANAAPMSCTRTRSEPACSACQLPVSRGCRASSTFAIAYPAPGSLTHRSS